MKIESLRFLSVVIGLFWSAAGWAQTPLFHAQALPIAPSAYSSGGSGINNANEVVGSIVQNPSCPPSSATVWPSGSGPVLLTPLSGENASYGVQINNAGEVVGAVGCTAYDFQASIWMNGVLTVLGPAGSVAEAINDAGQIVGASNIAYSPIATIWNGTSSLTLGLPANYTQSEALAINNSGLIAGYVCCYNSKPAAAVWHGTTPTVLPKPPGMAYPAKAYGVSDAGVVVGYVGYQAAAWVKNNVMLLGGFNSERGTQAYAMNKVGVIVGYGQTGSVGIHAAIWGGVTSKLQDLNGLIDAPKTTLMYATAINDQCAIIATGYSYATGAHTETPYLLTLINQANCVKGLGEPQ